MIIVIQTSYISDLYYNKEVDFMIMVRESDIHRQMAEQVAKIGRGPIVAENEDNKSFEAFREKRRKSNVDPSLNMFKHEKDIRGLPL